MTQTEKIDAAIALLDHVVEAFHALLTGDLTATRAHIAQAHTELDALHDN